jgi:hypothetical protein
VFRRDLSGFVEAKTNARRRRQKNQTIKKARMMPSAKTLAAHAGDLNSVFLDAIQSMVPFVLSGV